MLFGNAYSNSWRYPRIHIKVSLRFLEAVLLNPEAFIRTFFELLNEFYKGRFIVWIILFIQRYDQFGEKIIHIGLAVVVSWTFTDSFLTRGILIIKKKNTGEWWKTLDSIIHAI